MFIPDQRARDGMCLRELEHRRRNLLALGVGHAREQRQRADLLRQALAHRQAARAETEPGVGLGQVDRRGVVDRRGDPPLREVLTQRIARVGAHHEQVVDPIGAGERSL